MSDLEGIVLIATSRILEFFGIITTIFLMFKGYRTRYVFMVGGIVLFSVVVSLTGLLYREYIHYIALADIVITSLVLGGIVLYVMRHPERTKDFTPPDSVRCPVCRVFIINEDELCTMRIGHHTYYFDSFDHLVKLMKEIDFFLERNSLPRGEVRDIFVKTRDTGRWRKLEDVHVVEENGTLHALEKPAGGEINLEELLKAFKDKLRRDRAQALG